MTPVEVKLADEEVLQAFLEEGNVFCDQNFELAWTLLSNRDLVEVYIIFCMLTFP